MKKRNHSSLILPVLIFSLSFFAICELGFCRNLAAMKNINNKYTSSTSSSSSSSFLGSLKPLPYSAHIDSLARFALQQHNYNENKVLEFGRVVEAKEQVVAGKVYHITVEAIDGGVKKLYEAKVWVKPWMNLKQLLEFKYLSLSDPSHHNIPIQ